MLKKILFLFAIVFFVLQFGCKDDSPNEPQKVEKQQTHDFNFSMDIYPDIGSLETQFKFTFAEAEGQTIDSLFYFIELDLNGDGTYDKVCYDIDSVKTNFSNTGLRTVTAKFVFGESEFFCSSEAVVVDLIKAVPGQNHVIFEPNIYNSLKMVITWSGYEVRGHKLHMLDLQGNYEGCIFCDVPGVDTTEMHCPQLSFDGKRIVWDTGLDLYFYDFENPVNDAVIIYTPWYYEPGRVCWSLDNDKLFVIDTDRNGVNYIDINDNFSIKKVTDFGEYLCVVPSDPDLIAIMEDAGSFSSDSVKLSNLKYYSLS